MADQPASELRLGKIKAAIWRNETDGKTRYNVTFARLYRDDGQWKTSTSFGRDDLLLLAKLADQAHSTICDELVCDAPTGGAATEDESVAAVA